jgi:hypothetical protein
VAYAVPSPGKWQNEVHLQRSTDGGATWSRPVPLEAGGERGSHNEMAAAVTPGGTLVFAWLDKREGGRGLRVALFQDQGAGLEVEAQEIEELSPEAAMGFFLQDLVLELGFEKELRSERHLQLLEAAVRMLDPSQEDRTAVVVLVRFLREGQIPDRLGHTPI